MADVSQRPIQRLLVANRGEIARRIFRTAQRMGMATVAVYSEGDAQAPFVGEADSAIALRGRSAAESYLDSAQLLAACARAGADALHPGYGFLSENAAFAQAVLDAGLIWVGPSPQAIARIGDKLAAKRLAREVGVPMLEAVELTAGADAAAAALHIGYPVLIKAAAGGGGRGMRIVHAPDQLLEAVISARREAEAAFGNGTVFLERWLQASRHVEIQILGDQHGALVHLFERECSIQRRHQKVIEEAPSTALDAALRERMGQAALALGRAIGYHSAGTVEFMLSGTDFYFLEVNTRLQVEHPVTEEITGLDLVREQLRIAEGQALGYGQADLRISGHAIEARLYAENPALDFLPAPGTVAVWQPALGGGARFDSGVEAGSEIGIDFDPLLAKVIVHAPTRREATARLARVLETTRVQGITHNRDFLVACLRSPAFLSGDTTTDFITRAAPARTRLPAQAELDAAAIAAALHTRAQRLGQARVQRGIPGGFRNSAMPPQRVVYRAGDTELSVSYQTRRDASLTLEVSGRSYCVEVLRTGPHDVDLSIDGWRGTWAVCSVDGGAAGGLAGAGGQRRLVTGPAGGQRRLVHGPAGDIELIELPRFPIAAAPAFRGGLSAPMPGKVLAVAVALGDAVQAGQLLLVLEAMKMEHRITAPTAGTVQSLKVAVGDQVAHGALLIQLNPHEEARP